VDSNSPREARADTGLVDLDLYPRVARLCLPLPAALRRLPAARHPHVELLCGELAGGDLAAAPGQRDRRILAARRLDQAGALERAHQVERGALAPAAQAAALR